jgi:hypothetical protein
LDYFAPGGRLGLLLARPTTAPIATAPAAMAPTLISRERTWRCFAGAIAIPAGLDAAPPLVVPTCAAAAPAGSCVFFFCDVALEAAPLFGVCAACESGACDDCVSCVTRGCVDPDCADGAPLEFCEAAGGAAESPGAALCVELAESCGWVCGVALWAVASSGPAHSTIASTRHSDRSSVGRITVPLSPRHPWKFRLKTLRHKPRIALWRNCSWNFPARIVAQGIR